MGILMVGHFGIRREGCGSESGRGAEQLSWSEAVKVGVETSQDPPSHKSGTESRYHHPGRVKAAAGAWKWWSASIAAVLSSSPLLKGGKAGWSMRGGGP